MNDVLRDLLLLSFLIFANLSWLNHNGIVVLAQEAQTVSPLDVYPRISDYNATATKDDTKKQQGRSGGELSPSQLDGEYRLLNKWRNEKSAARPRRNFEDMVYVTVGFTLFQISQIEEDIKVAALHGGTVMQWRDDYHTWNVSEYGGVTVVSVPADYVWKPDVVSYSGASRDKALNIFGQTNINIMYDGRVLWSPPTTIVVPFVPMNDSSWPHDRQHITFKLGTWASGTALVRLVAARERAFVGGTADASDFVEGPRWKLIAFSGHGQRQQFKCCPGAEVSMITFDLEIERKPNFLIHLIGYPLKLVLFSSCAVFALPVAAIPLRLLVCAMYFLVYSVLLHVLQSIMPAGAVYGPSVPLPVAAVVSAIALMLADVYVIVVIGLASRVNKYAFPSWARSILHGLAASLCLDRVPGEVAGDYDNAVMMYHRMNNDMGAGDVVARAGPRATAASANNNGVMTANGATNGHTTNGLAPASSTNAPWSAFPDGTTSTANVGHVLKVTYDWRLLALVMNRFAFIVNLIICIAITVSTP